MVLGYTLQFSVAGEAGRGKGSVYVYYAVRMCSRIGDGCALLVDSGSVGVTELTLVGTGNRVGMKPAVPDVRPVGPIDGRVAMTGGAPCTGGEPVRGRRRGVVGNVDRMQYRIAGSVGEVVAEGQTARKTVAGNIRTGHGRFIENWCWHACAKGGAARIVEPDKPQAIGPVNPVAGLTAVGPMLVMGTAIERVQRCHGERDLIGRCFFVEGIDRPIMGNPLAAVIDIIAAVGRIAIDHPENRLGGRRALLQLSVQWKTVFIHSRVAGGVAGGDDGDARGAVAGRGGQWFLGLIATSGGEQDGCHSC